MTQDEHLEQWEKDKINKILRIAYDVLGTPDDERSFH